MYCEQKGKNWLQRCLAGCVEVHFNNKLATKASLLKVNEEHLPWLKTCLGHDELLRQINKDTNLQIESPMCYILDPSITLGPMRNQSRCIQREGMAYTKETIWRCFFRFCETGKSNTLQSHMVLYVVLTAPISLLAPWWERPPS